MQRQKKDNSKSLNPVSFRSMIQTSKTRSIDTKDYAHRTRTCRFCTNSCQSLYYLHNKLWQIEQTTDIHKILNYSLPQKYSQSQSYYYTKPINEFLHNQRSTQVINLKEIISYCGVDGEEWMRRFYIRSEMNHKIQLLTEYYRFHNEIPRLFMLPTSDIMNNYHDKKRRIEYFRIAREIEEENKRNPDKPPKGIVGDKPDVRRDSNDGTVFSHEGKDRYYGNLLDDITLESSIVYIQIQLQQEKPNNSVTVQDLYQRLEEIVNSKYNDKQGVSLIDSSMAKLKTNEDEKLKDFFVFVQKREKDLAAKQKLTKKELKLDDQNFPPQNTQVTQHNSNSTQITQNNYKPQIGNQKILVTQKIDEFTLVKSPSSARNIPQNVNIILAQQKSPKQSQIQNNNPFFLSEALQQKISSQTNTQIKQNPTKQAFSISPRNINGQSSHLYATLQRLPQSTRASMIQGFQGSQEAYQYPNENIVVQSKVSQYQPTRVPNNKIISRQYPTNQTNHSKNSSKIGSVVTAESSPNQKLKVGSQTHRVTSHKDIQQLFKVQQLRQAVEQGISKENLNKLLTPVNPGKSLNDFFLLQLKAFQKNNSQSNASVKGSSQHEPAVQTQQSQINNQMVKRATKNPKFRKSINNMEVTKQLLPTTTQQTFHQYTRSEAHPIQYLNDRKYTKHY